MVFKEETEDSAYHKGVKIKHIGISFSAEYDGYPSFLDVLRVIFEKMDSLSQEIEERSNEGITKVSINFDIPEQKRWSSEQLEDFKTVLKIISPIAKDTVLSYGHSKLNDKIFQFFKMMLSFPNMDKNASDIIFVLVSSFKMVGHDDSISLVTPSSVSAGEISPRDSIDIEERNTGPELVIKEPRLSRYSEHRVNSFHDEPKSPASTLTSERDYDYELDYIPEDIDC